MKMKKTYITPSTEAQRIGAEDMLASSDNIRINTTYDGGYEQLSNDEKTWGFGDTGWDNW